tara:strand:- start:468 stop:962 length:495 start_codon:yes stop_codon:yes gene_type:complete
MAKVNLDIADRLDITCRQGDTFELTITLKDNSGTGLPLVTDEYSFLMQVRGTTSSRRPIALLAQSEGGGGGEADSDDALIVDGGVANTNALIIGSAQLGEKAPVNFTFKNVDNSGNVTVFLSALDMSKVKAGRYRYDFQFKVGDTQTTVLEGTFKVNSDISKAL